MRLEIKSWAGLLDRRWRWHHHSHPRAHRGAGKPRARGEEEITTRSTGFLYKIHKFQIRDNYIQNKGIIKRAELSCLHPYRKVSCAGAGAGSPGCRSLPRVPPIPNPSPDILCPGAFLPRRQRCCGYREAAEGEDGVVKEGPSPQSSPTGA